MPPLSEIALVGFTLVTAASSPVLLANAPADDAYALQWFLLPLLGSLMASCTAFFLNPHPEARKAVLGRCIFGITIGTGLPSIVSMFHPSLASIADHPALKFLSGFAFCLVFYILARPFVGGLYARSGSVGDELANNVSKKISQVTVTKTKTETETEAK
jgi:hypothetical protein